MNTPLHQAGFSVSARFANQVLRKACIAHRSSRLASYHRPTTLRAPLQSQRHYATAVSNTAPANAVQQEPSASPQPYDLRSGTTSVESTKSRELIGELDPYLPLELRSKTWLENLSAFEGVRNPLSLPEALKNLSTSFQHGVFGFMALEQRRWPAFLYLADALVKTSHESRPDLGPCLQGVSAWQDTKMNFSNIHQIGGQVRLELNRDQPPMSPALLADRLTTALHEEESSLASYHHAMGQLWQGLGRIILHTADSDRELSEYMMSFVHRVLSTMHNEGKMHPLIYHYDTDRLPLISRKPPFLHFLSSRLMTVISDSTWRANENKIIDNYTLLGAAYASSGGLELKDFYPAVRRIGPEAWLELVLWSCVHGGHIDAAASLLRDVVPTDGEARWQSISWTHLLQDSQAKNGSKNAEQLRQRFDRIAGAHEGYSRDPPAVDLPPRSVSSEVIASIIEGLAEPMETSSSISRARDVIAIRRLMEPTARSDRAFWNMVATRLLDCADVGGAENPQFLRLVSRVLTDNEEDVAKGTAATVKSMYHRAISAVISNDNLNQALSLFLGLQRHVDAKQQEDLRSFFRSNPASLVHDRYEHVTKSPQLNMQAEHDLEIPTPTLAALLDLATKHRMFKLGAWLLDSLDPDGPIISQKARSDPVVQSALLRFAVATDNHSLIVDVAQRARSYPGRLPDTLLRPLLHSHVEMQRFSESEQILEHMRLNSIEVNAEDVLILARQILHLETHPDPNSRHSMSNASRLLSHVLQKRFIAPSQPYTNVDYGPYRLLNQLSRVLASVGGQLYSTSMKGIVQIGQASGSSSISAQDFNILLESVAQTRGAALAKAMYDKWCIAPGLKPRRNLVRDKYVPLVGWDQPDDEPCVNPSPQTVRVIMQSILAKADFRPRDGSGEGLKTTSQPASQDQVGASTAKLRWEGSDGLEDDSSRPSSVLKDNLPIDNSERHLLEWGITELRSMGLSVDEVTKDMPEIFDERIISMQSWRDD